MSPSILRRVTRCNKNYTSRVISIYCQHKLSKKKCYLLTFFARNYGERDPLPIILLVIQPTSCKRKKMYDFLLFQDQQWKRFERISLQLHLPRSRYRPNVWVFPFICCHWILMTLAVIHYLPRSSPNFPIPHSKIPSHLREKISNFAR